MAMIVRKVDEQVVRQRIRDGYLNATAMCKAAGKRFGNYYQNQNTKEFLRALKADTGIPVSELVQVVRGGFPELQGTWVHPDVAVHLAIWLSPEFAVQVSRWVREWLEIAATRRVTLERYLTPVKRAWAKTFPDDLWREFARLTGHQGSIHERPKWWGHLVNTLIYKCLDPDVAAYLRENQPNPRKGQNYHQWLSSDHGLPKLKDHIREVIGIAKTCYTIRQLQEQMQRIYGDQQDLNLIVDPPQDPDRLLDEGWPY